jgi:MFS family permease
MAGTDSNEYDQTRVTPAVARTDTARTDTARTERVPAEGASVTRGAGRDAVAAQHARFGGIQWGAAFFGWLSANGLAVVLIALLSAAGVALGLAQNVDTANEAVDQAAEIGIGGGIAVLVVLFLAYLAGGYVAGRMARFDGTRQGLAVWLVGLIVVIVLAVAGALLGAQYNVLEQLNLPRIPIDEGTATTAGIITLVAILLVTLLGAVLGGKLGDRYHRRVDRVGYEAL